MLYFAPWKTTLVLVIVVIGALFAAPNLLSQSQRDALPGFLPSGTLNLGLDLQGGSHLLLEVDVNSVRDERLDSLLEDARTALRQAGIRTATGYNVTEGALHLRVTDPDEREAAEAALKALSEPVGGGIGGGVGAAQSLSIQRADAAFTLIITPEALEDIRKRTVRQSIEIIRRRIDALGTTEPVIQAQGDQRVLVQAPGVEDPQRLKELIGTTAKMTFHLVASDNPRDIARAIEGRVSPLQLLLPTERASEPYLLVEKRARLSGEDLRRASQGFHPQTGEPIVNFTFDTSGARIFGRLTSEHVKERFAVVLDDVIITAPTINTAILGGAGYIEGQFTVETASDLAALLNAGALPAPLTIVEERTVGAELGADSVAAGRVALFVGFLAVMAFMLVAYGLFGVFSNVALLANVVLILGSLSGLQATLTLPGIAGIILTIGMAVDANVLIFERVREEVRAGRTPANAVEAGYSRALATILDANITTFLAAAVLFQLGSGPVRGFAVTLAIGIVTSVFTAFVFSRLLVATWFRFARPKKLRI